MIFLFELIVWRCSGSMLIDYIFGRYTNFFLSLFIICLFFFDMIVTMAWYSIVSHAWITSRFVHIEDNLQHITMNNRWLGMVVDCLLQGKIFPILSKKILILLQQVKSLTRVPTQSRLIHFFVYPSKILISSFLSNML